ncbi:MAG: hypothetical protein AABY22_15495 [Nanoarchaeota archaeon]
MDSIPSGQYKITTQQVGPINFQIFIESFNGNKFSSILNCHPQQLTEENIMNNFRDKKIFKNHWNIEI